MQSQQYVLRQLLSVYTWIAEKTVSNANVHYKWVYSSRRGVLTRHDSSLWEVTREEIVIDGDILVANCILLRL